MYINLLLYCTPVSSPFLSVPLSFYQLIYAVIFNFFFRAATKDDSHCRLILQIGEPKEKS